ncbi:MAG: hypothetical protein ACOVN5_12090 [Aquidulcibacter sp.]
MTGPLETVLRNHNVWCCVCHGLLAGFKLAIGSLAEAAAYLAITFIHALGVREDFRRKPPRGPLPPGGAGGDGAREELPRKPPHGQ